MSGEARPIDAEQFALAIQDLPVENLYSKANEINNSITHLEGSNRQLQEYSDSIRTDTSLPESTRQEGDKDCLEAIQENLIVIRRQKDRIGLLKQEVERRGGRWHGGGSESNGEGDGDDAERPQQTATNGAATTGGRLTDEQLQQQLRDRMGDDDADDADGMHL
ncbi:uncharacterized protein A1O9_08173 [Exophiala aquamarina CBS 119918]|uniref:Uncharacterized protein n=1 Tax=Exophiala aquamarina CBS 119918 TaxID=1182545 RepID=A0A072P812_9EURO|nr:uncharacterized protein A1O9_08173 [Exophiala aquamarina CBS 119918]KEF55423.1 hypothetical protein A1O9_08173 [Exophiala aquamarina CBS 119918]